MPFHLIHAGRYIRRERYVQTCDHCYLSLNLSGLIYSHLYTPEGRFLGDMTGVGVHLVPPKYVIDFEYGPDRENFALALELPGLTKVPNEPRLQFTWNDHRFTLPFDIELPLAQRLLLREQFSRVVELFHESTPAAFFAGECLTYSLLGEYILSVSRQAVSSEGLLAERFRRAIDNDRTFSVPLDELAAEAGAAIGPARRSFFAHYGLSPGEYRSQRRQNRILELLAQTSHPLSRIAREVGMKNAPHLYAFVQRRFGVTPRTLRQQFRGG